MFRWRTMGVSLLLIGIVLGMAAGPWTVRAQTPLSEVYVAEDGSFQFSHSEEWFVQADAEGGFVKLSNAEAVIETSEMGPEDVLLVFVGPAMLGALVPDAESPEAVAEGMAALIEATVTDLQTVTVEARDVTVAMLDSTDVNRMLVIVPFDQGGFGQITVSSEAKLSTFEETVIAIAGTFNNYVPANPCTVRVEDGQYASMRVGPGPNRGELGGMPTGQDIPVIGQGEADDGSLWWRLDKDVAVPGSDANEIWVAQDEVTASGECDRVQQASAPPIIPMAPPPPPPAPAAAQPQGGQTEPQPAQPAPSNKGQGIYISLPEWQSQLPANMRASSQASARLVANVGVTFYVVQQETYIKGNGELTTVRRNRVDYQVIVYDAATGAEVARQTFMGTEPPPFPNVMSISGTLNGDPPSFGAALPWFQALLGM